MNININELLKYLKEKEMLMNNDDFQIGYGYCLSDIKEFAELKFNEIVNV